MATSNRPRRKHFSMLRSFHLADLFTLGNGACGVAAIFHAMRFMETTYLPNLYLAVALVPIALVFDVLDGRIARWRHKASPMGRELDSLADVISFGVAPACIAFAIGLRSGLDQVILSAFVLCGLSRLARYNITADDLASSTGKVEYFEGTPIPTSIIPLLIAVTLYHYDALGLVTVGVPFHLASLVFAVSGGMMISKTLHIPKP